MTHVLVEQRDGIAIVTLNRPEKRNAMSPEMVVRLAAFWDEIARDHATRVIVVTGAGDKAFSAEVDLNLNGYFKMRGTLPRSSWLANEKVSAHTSRSSSMRAAERSAAGRPVSGVTSPRSLAPFPQGATGYLVRALLLLACGMAFAPSAPHA